MSSLSSGELETMLIASLKTIRRLLATHSRRVDLGFGLFLRVPQQAVETYPGREGGLFAVGVERGVMALSLGVSLSRPRWQRSSW